MRWGKFIMKEKITITTLHILFIALALICVFSSCSIEKRKYLSGYNIEWRHANPPNNTKQDYSTTELHSVEESEKLPDNNNSEDNSQASTDFTSPPTPLRKGEGSERISHHEFPSPFGEGQGEVNSNDNSMTYSKATKINTMEIKNKKVEKIMSINSNSKTTNANPIIPILALVCSILGIFFLLFGALSHSRLAVPVGFWGVVWGVLAFILGIIGVPSVMAIVALLIGAFFILWLVLMAFVFLNWH